MKKTMMVLNITAVAALGTTAALATVIAGNENSEKDSLLAKQAEQSKKKQQIKDNADANLAKVTEKMVNDAINAKKAHTNTDVASTWTLPTSVDVTVVTGSKSAVVKVELKKVKGDDANGEIYWTGITSTKGATKTGTVKGELGGFQTTALKQKRAVVWNPPNLPATVSVFVAPFVDVIPVQ